MLGKVKKAIASSWQWLLGAAAILVVLIVGVIPRRRQLSSHTPKLPDPDDIDVPDVKSDLDAERPVETYEREAAEVESGGITDAINDLNKTF